MAYILVVPLAMIFVMVPLMILRGWVLTHLWSWFITPIFALPTLSIVQAIGVSFVCGFLTSKSLKWEDDPNAGKSLILNFVSPLFALGVAWVVKTYFM